MKPLAVLQKAFSLKRAIKIGGSYAFSLPPDWVQVYADEIEGEYWLEVNVDGKEISITALTLDDMERLSEMVKENRQ